MVPTEQTIDYQQLQKNGSFKWVYRWQEAPQRRVVPQGYGGAVDHQNHFHIYLRPPGYAPIDTAANRLAAASIAADVSPNGDIGMPLLDLPIEASALALPIVQLVQASNPAVVGADKTLWIGQMFVRDSGRPSDIWDVAGVACDLLKQEGWFSRNGLNAVNPRCEVVSILQMPKHGQLKRLADGTYEYSPTPRYLGNDMIQFVVSAEGKKVLIMCPIIVREDEPKSSGLSP